MYSNLYNENNKVKTWDFIIIKNSCYSSNLVDIIYDNNNLRLNANLIRLHSKLL